MNGRDLGDGWIADLAAELAARSSRVSQGVPDYGARSPYRRARAIYAERLTRAAEIFTRPISDLEWELAGQAPPADPVISAMSQAVARSVRGIYADAVRAATRAQLLDVLAQRAIHLAASTHPDPPQTRRRR